MGYTFYSQDLGMMNEHRVCPCPSRTTPESRESLTITGRRNTGVWMGHTHERKQSKEPNCLDRTAPDSHGTSPLLTLHTTGRPDNPALDMPTESAVVPGYTYSKLCWVHSSCYRVADARNFSATPTPTTTVPAAIASSRVNTGTPPSVQRRCARAD